MQTLSHECRLRLAETIKFGANPPDPWPTVRQAAEEAEGENPSQPPFSGEWANLPPKRIQAQSSKKPQCLEKNFKFPLLRWVGNAWVLAREVGVPAAQLGLSCSGT